MKDRQLSAWGLALLLLLSLGCAATRPESLVEDRASELRQAKIEYQVAHGGTGSVRPAAHQEHASSSGDAITTIEYPHPTAMGDCALVTVVELNPAGIEPSPSRLASFGSWADRMFPGLSLGEGQANAKGLKISKQQLDELLRELVMQGGLESAPQSQVSLTIEINGARQTARPRHAPPLEELTERVRREGKLLPADHPHVAQRVAERAPTDGFYRSFQESESTE